MITAIGSLLVGVAAIITSVTGLIAALRRKGKRPGTDVMCPLA